MGAMCKPYRPSEGFPWKILKAKINWSGNREKYEEQWSHKDNWMDS